MPEVRIYLTNSCPESSHFMVTHQAASLVRFGSRSIMLKRRKAVPTETHGPGLPSRRKTAGMARSALKEDLASAAPRLRHVEPERKHLDECSGAGRKLTNQEVWH